MLVDKAFEKLTVEVPKSNVPLTTKGVPSPDKSRVLAPAASVVLALMVRIVLTIVFPSRVLVFPVDVVKLL